MVVTPSVRRLVSYVAAAALALGSGARADIISTDYDNYNDGELGHRPHLYHRSSAEYSPLLQVNAWNASAISDRGSHIFLRHDGYDKVKSPLASPLILDAHDLSAVFINRSFENVFGTRVQADRGRTYLTFWEGKKGDGVGDGYGLVYDDTYSLVHTVSAQNIAVHSDLHEFALTGNGTALVTGVDKVVANTSSWERWPGPSEFEVLDAIFQEIDLDTNEVVFEWRALDHIDPMDSFERAGHGWDVYHMNSVEKTQQGNYLVSIRHISSILLIDGQTGDILWRLGGKRNDFRELAPAPGSGSNADGTPLSAVLTMGWQHHARWLPRTNETEMTFFDNHVKETTHGVCRSDCSRGLHVAIDGSASPPTVRLLREFVHPSHLQAQSQGSVQPLSTGPGGELENVFIGWGRCPSFTEHAPTGETVMDVQFSPWHSDEVPDALDNYRAYKLDWAATPWWGPAVALRRPDLGGLNVYVSWNGATEVREWVVFGHVAVPATNDTAAYNTTVELARSARTGFETRLVVPAHDGLQRLWAEALDGAGAVLRATELLDAESGDVVILPESEDAALMDPLATAEAAANATSGWTLLAGGLVGLAAVAGAMAVWRRRREKYDRVDSDDDDEEGGGGRGGDFKRAREEDSDSDAGDDFAMDHFGGDPNGPEAWEDYRTYLRTFPR